MGDHDSLSSPESNAAQGKVQTRILEHRHAGKTDDWELCQFRYVAELSETGMGRTASILEFSRNGPEYGAIGVPIFTIGGLLFEKVKRIACFQAFSNEY